MGYQLLMERDMNICQLFRCNIKIKIDLRVLFFELFITVFVLKTENKNRAINLVSAGLKRDHRYTSLNYRNYLIEKIMAHKKVFSFCTLCSVGLFSFSHLALENI
jgi:succinate-acetate transporter protein